MNNSLKNKSFFVILIILLILTTEFISRLYWSYIYKHSSLSFLAPEKKFVFYPELKEIVKIHSTTKDEFYDILFLGGSVMYSVAREERTCRILQEIIGPQTGKKVRVFNASGSGHTTLDNLYKYEYLKKRKFDLVVYYENINEVRANNCPPEMFKNDYSHYSWYKKVNFLENYPFFKEVTCPYTIYASAIVLLEKFNIIKFVPKNRPRPEWTRYGGDIRSSLPYRQNLTHIIKLAKQKEENVLLIKFATHVPTDYSEQDFLHKKLDYDYSKKIMMPIEIWGEMANVRKGIDAHNMVLEELVSQQKTYYLDANLFLPKNGTIFSDICHLSDKGIDLFAKSVGHYIENNIVIK